MDHNSADEQKFALYKAIFERQSPNNGQCHYFAVNPLKLKDDKYLNFFHNEKGELYVYIWTKQPQGAQMQECYQLIPNNSVNKEHSEAPFQIHSLNKQGDPEVKEYIQSLCSHTSGSLKSLQQIILQQTNSISKEQQPTPPAHTTKPKKQPKHHVSSVANPVKSWFKKLTHHFHLTLPKDIKQAYQQEKPEKYNVYNTLLKPNTDAAKKLAAKKLLEDSGKAIKKHNKQCYINFFHNSQNGEAFAYVYEYNKNQQKTILAVYKLCASTQNQKLYPVPLLHDHNHNKYLKEIYLLCGHRFKDITDPKKRTFLQRQQRRILQIHQKAQRSARAQNSTKQNATTKIASATNKLQAALSDLSMNLTETEQDNLKSRSAQNNLQTGSVLILGELFTDARVQQQMQKNSQWQELLLQTSDYDVEQYQQLLSNFKTVLTSKQCKHNINAYLQKQHRYLKNSEYVRYRPTQNSNDSKDNTTKSMPFQTFLKQNPYHEPQNMYEQIQQVTNCLQQFRHYYLYAQKQLQNYQEYYKKHQHYEQEYQGRENAIPDRTFITVKNNLDTISQLSKYAKQQYLECANHYLNFMCTCINTTKEQQNQISIADRQQFTKSRSSSYYPTM